MKKLLAIFLLLVSANAFAQFHHHGHHFYRHGGGGGWIAPLIGGAIIGAVISDAARDKQPAPIIIQQPQPIYQPNTYNCLVQVYDPITRTYRNEVMVCVSQ